MLSLVANLKDPGSISGATLTLAIGTVGAGMLALPGTFAGAGVPLSLTALTIVASFTVFSCRCLAQACEKLDLHCYEDLSRELLGPTFETFIRCLLIFYNLAAAIAYVVVIGDLFEPLQGYVTAVFPMLSTSKHTMVAFWFVVMLPMCLVRNISSLRFSSFCAIAAALYLSCSIFYRYCVPNTSCGPHPVIAHSVLPLQHNSLHHQASATVQPAAVSAVRTQWNGMVTILAIPILMFSYDCESLVFQIFNSLNDKSVDSLTKVASGSVIIASSLYASVGLFGYLAHGVQVTDNILNSYDPKCDPVFALAYVLYVLPVVMAYTLTIFPVRDAIFNFLFHYSAGGRAGESAVSHKIFLVTSAILSCITVTLAVVSPDIVSILALLGGLCSSTLCLSYPAAFRIRLHASGILPATPWEFRGMYAMLGLGLFGALFGTFAGIVKAFGLPY